MDAARREAIMPKALAALMGQALRFVASFDKDRAKAGPASGAQPISVASALAAAGAVGLLTSKNFSKWHIVGVQVADLNNSFLETDVLKMAVAVPSYCHFLMPGYLIS